MAFTYVGDLSTDRDKVRFWLQDTEASNGPKPSDGNFSDAEIDGLVATYGSWQRAVYAGLMVLSTAWRRFPDFRTESGFSVNRTDIADGYHQQALDWAKQYGIPTGLTGSQMGYAAMTRVDGYSDDVDNQTA
jgi:hypothetical protein